MKIQIRISAFLAYFLCSTAVFAAESDDFMIIDELLFDAATEAESDDYILEAAIMPESTIAEYTEMIIAICGDGILDTDEVCDGNNFGGVSCATLGYNSGSLTCATDCQSYAVNNCSFGTPTGGGSGGGSSGGNSGSDRQIGQTPPANTILPTATASPRTPLPTPQATAPTPSPRPSPRPTAQVSVSPPTPTPSIVTPRPTPTPASFLDFGPNTERPPVTTSDESPLLAGNMGTDVAEGYLQVTDADGNIITQTPIIPNRNGAFAYTPDTELPPGQYNFSVYDVTVPNANPLWTQSVVIEPAYVYGPNAFVDSDTSTSDGDAFDRLSPDSARIFSGNVTGDEQEALTRMVSYFGRQVGQVQEIIRNIAGREVIVDTDQVSDTVSHIAIEGQGAPLLPLDRPINLGSIGRSSDETVVIKGKTKPGANVIIYFQKQAPPQALFDYGANLLYDPQLDAYYYEAIADRNGIFEIPISAEMPEGDYVVRTAIIEIDEKQNRIFLGEDREFAFSLFSAPKVEDHIVNNSYQSFLVNTDSSHKSALWFPIAVGISLAALSIFLFTKKITHFRKRENQLRKHKETTKRQSEK